MSDHTGSSDGDTSMTIVQHAYGSDADVVLEMGHAARPVVGDDDVLVQVHAASVDRGTWHVMAGLPYPIRVAGFGLRAPRYRNPGRSLAGVVVAVGEAVRDLAPGDEVYGIGEATFAEHAKAPAAKLAPKPASLSFEAAATLPISGLTALQAVRDHARIQPGQRVLITGASGGVGSFAVQIAKAFGAHVTGVSSTAKLDFVRRLGADRVVDYTAEDPLRGDQQYDAVLDIAGNARLSLLRKALTADGTLVIVGGETEGRWLGGTQRQIAASLISPLVSQKLGTFIASENAADLVALSELVEEGAVTPPVDRTYPLSGVPTAINDLVNGAARGKVAITVRPPRDTRQNPPAVAARTPPASGSDSGSV